VEPAVRPAAAPAPLEDFPHTPPGSWNRVETSDDENSEAEKAAVDAPRQDCCPQAGQSATRPPALEPDTQPNDDDDKFL
jgi:hypothetical protein